MSAPMFWACWVEDAPGPRVKHWSLQAATREAQRLATIAPGKNVYVVQAVSACRNEPNIHAVALIGPSLEEIAREREIPF